MSWPPRLPPSVALQRQLQQQQMVIAQLCRCPEGPHKHDKPHENNALHEHDELQEHNKPATVIAIVTMMGCMSTTGRITTTNLTSTTSRMSTTIHTSKTRRAAMTNHCIRCRQTYRTLPPSLWCHRARNRMVETWRVSAALVRAGEAERAQRGIGRCQGG